MLEKLSEYLGQSEKCFAHYCPACDDLHYFAVKKPFMNGHQWYFNNDFEKPTFSPSMNIKVGPDSDGRIERCHYYLKKGVLSYLNDCTHEMAGQVIDLPPIPAKYFERNAYEPS